MASKTDLHKWFRLMVLFMAAGWPGWKDFQASDAFGGRIEGAASKILLEGLAIRQYPVPVPNNWGEDYPVILSVLGYERNQEFLPLLAIAYETPGRPGGRAMHWLAVWNFSGSRPGASQHLKALLPIPGWSKARRGSPSRKPPARLPGPVLEVGGKKSGSRNHFFWWSSLNVANYLGLPVLSRFLFQNYLHYRDDLKERQFHQLYLLLRIYEDLLPDHSATDLPDPQMILDIKFRLLSNRNMYGLMMDGNSRYEAVAGYESLLRSRAGMTSSYLQSRASLHRLVYKEIRYSLPGGPLTGMAAMICVHAREREQPRLPWPGHNPFDLRYDPYTHPDIVELMEMYPDREIPVAFYALTGGFRLKPVILYDFFDEGNIAIRETTGLARVALDNLLNTIKVPLSGQALRAVGGFALNRKDYSQFSNRSTAAGVEPLRLIARLGWSQDADSARLLLNNLDRRVSNPLADSAKREQERSRRDFQALSERLSGEVTARLRRLLENRIRQTLALGNRAVMRQDYQNFIACRDRLEALALVREWLGGSSRPSCSWDRLLEALEKTATREKLFTANELIQLQQRLQLMSTRSVPVELLPRWEKIGLAFNSGVPAVVAAGGN